MSDGNGPGISVGNDACIMGVAADGVAVTAVTSLDGVSLEDGFVNGNVRDAARRCSRMDRRRVP